MVRDRVECATRTAGFRQDLRKYLLLQLPNWVFAVGLLTILSLALELPRWVWLTLPVLVGKDLLLFPAMRCIFRPPFSGMERLIGARAHVIESLDPMGYVQLDSELWRAVAREGGTAIAMGCSVVVRNVDGLTLIVDEDPVTVLRPLPKKVEDATLPHGAVPPKLPAGAELASRVNSEEDGEGRP